MTHVDTYGIDFYVRILIAYESYVWCLWLESKAKEKKNLLFQARDKV